MKKNSYTYSIFFKILITCTCDPCLLGVVLFICMYLCSKIKTYVLKYQWAGSLKKLLNFTKNVNQIQSCWLTFILHSLWALSCYFHIDVHWCTLKLQFMNIFIEHQMIRICTHTSFSFKIKKQQHVAMLWYESLLV